MVVELEELDKVKRHELDHLLAYKRRVKRHIINMFDQRISQ
jgi:hypothetical protein